MRRHGVLCLVPAGMVLGILLGLSPATPQTKKVLRRVSPAYTVMVSLQTNAPFVGDGRMTFADLAFSATFRDVVFVYDPEGMLGFCSVEAREGKLFLTRHEFNDVQEGDDRHRPWVKKEWPMEFSASLTMSRAEIAKYLPKDKEDLPIVPLGPPEQAALHFCAKFGMLDLMWYSTLGSNALSDTHLEFDAPWQKLLEGKPVTLKIPYETTDPEEKGEWWIEFLPPKKK